MKTVKYYLQVSIAAFAAAMACTSCNDKWDEHYDLNSDLASGTTAGATLWENLNTDKELAPFNKVLEACGYDLVLSSAEMHTVWAPVISETDANDLINRYQTELANGRKGSENAVVKQFVQNHIAQYNHQISSLTSGTVKMMNDKYMQLSHDLFNGEVAMSSERKPSSNGMLYKLDGSVAYNKNVWESIQADSVGQNGLDSLARFLESFEDILFDAEASVPGILDEDGNQHYVDSVTTKYNLLFTALRAQIDSEDSLYYALAPTNSVWKDKIEEYKNYFICAHDVTYPSGYTLETYRDSLQYAMAKQVLVYGMFFNMLRQPDKILADSICSTLWTGSDYSDYNGEYRFLKPFANGGIFDGATSVDASNGRLYKTNDWRITPEQTFMQPIKVEAETADYTSDESTTKSYTITPISADAETEFKVSNSRYLYVYHQTTATRTPIITFDIPNTLSNVPYDIKVVFATALANDTASTDTLPRRVTFKLQYYRSTTADQILQNAETLLSNYMVDGMKMDTVLVKSGMVFPVCNFSDENARVKLTLESRVTSREADKTLSDKLLIDCIIFEPHVTPVDEGE